MLSNGRPLVCKSEPACPPRSTRSTGFPKGVMLSHRKLFASAMGVGCAGIIGEGGRVLHAAPMFHLADLGSTPLHTALGGSHVFLSPPWSRPGRRGQLRRYAPTSG